MKLYAPESFEYVLLSSGLFRDNEITQASTQMQYSKSRIKWWKQFTGN
ncbi:MAG: hypothetical protein K6G81_08930 [Lachnospiraceae bacterium]|nr:hypothetical protein [Lachnospiraceae bacterium]